MKLKTLVVTIVMLAVISIGVYIVQRPEQPKAADTRIDQRRHWRA